MAKTVPQVIHCFLVIPFKEYRISLMDAMTWFLLNMTEQSFYFGFSISDRSSAASSFLGLSSRLKRRPSEP